MPCHFKEVTLSISYYYKVVLHDDTVQNTSKPASLHFRIPEAMHSHTSSVQYPLQQLNTNNTQKLKNIQIHMKNCKFMETGNL